MHPDSPVAPRVSNPPALAAIAGPTGAGKSALALHLAEHFQGEIVNCDSLQLYRGFDIGTAKIPEPEWRGIAHHLFDVLEPSQGYSAGEYARDARNIIEEISKRGRLPVAAGGTGFYLRALLHGLPELPSRDEALRARLALREQNRPGTLHRLLQRLDPPSAGRIHTRDVQKLIRALEVRILTRQPLSKYKYTTPPPASHGGLTGYRVLLIGLNPDRDQLYQTLAARTRAMFATGLVDEVRRLLERGCTGSEKPFESLGYAQALALVRGTMSLEQAIESTLVKTRQYAKRQLTWFRRVPEIHWLAGFGSSPEVHEESIRLVDSFLFADRDGIGT